MKSKRTPELEAIILEAMSNGIPLAWVCRENDLHPTTWNDWCAADATLNIAHARARDAGYDAIAVDCLAIADDREDDPASRRVRTDVRLKLLAKWDPKRYGDKQQVEHSGGVSFNATPADESIL